MMRTLVPRWTKMVGIAAVNGLAASASAGIVIGTTTTPFTDISATGTNVGTASDDSEINITLAALTGAGWAGNELLPLVAIRVGNNGCVLWSSTAGEVGYVNSTTLPTMAASNSTVLGNGGLTAGTRLLAPLWDDNTPATGQSLNALDWQVIGGNLIIQWSNEDHFNATGTGTVQFQAIIYAGATIASGAPLVDFVYNDTSYGALLYQNDGGSATIGYKNWGTVAAANDVEFGTGGGNNTIGDPPFGDPTMRPKVAGYVASNDPTLPNAVRISGVPVAPPIVPSCFGDDSGTDCPCSTAGGGSVPPGAAGNGCPNSVNPLGANLAGTGITSISADSVPGGSMSLNGTGMTNTSVLYFQGDGLIGAGPTAGSIFGDGLRCVGTSVIRLKTLVNTAGASSYPDPGSPSVSIRGGVVAPGVKHYQAWYRNADPSFCIILSTFNLTNAVTVTWVP